MLKPKKFLAVALILFLMLPLILAAQSPDQAGDQNSCDSTEGLCLNVPIGNVKHVSGFEEYFKLWYEFIVGTVGILATVIIMWGGFKWLTSRGNSAAISDAKDRIYSAIIGLFLVFLSYNILAIINPNLVSIGLPTLGTAKTVTVSSSGRGTGTGSSLPPLEDIDTSPLPGSINIDYEFIPDDPELEDYWEFNQEVRFSPDGLGEYWASWDNMGDQAEILYFLRASRDLGMDFTITGIQTGEGLFEVTDNGTVNPDDPFDQTYVSFTLDGEIVGDILGVRISLPEYLPNFD
ncbi:MAG: pilin [Candidatus Buchananbacteria bacterium]|nr:pilin [Candidatus Buchananbacteria bacterium]